MATGKLSYIPKRRGKDQKNRRVSFALQFVMAAAKSAKDKDDYYAAFKPTLGLESPFRKPFRKPFRIDHQKQQIHQNNSTKFVWAIRQNQWSNEKTKKSLKFFVLHAISKRLLADLLLWQLNGLNGLFAVSTGLFILYLPKNNLMIWQNRTIEGIGRVVLIF